MTYLQSATLLEAFRMFACSLVVVGITADPHAADSSADLGTGLIFHAGFDGQVDADVAEGDGRLYTAVSRDEVKVGLVRDDVTIAQGKGRYGDALRFTEKKGPTLFFQADKNMGFAAKSWSGTVSFWLNLDPDEDLEPGYCDPIQITDKSALDASIFVEFTKDHTPRRFRMAVCPNYKEWNPEGVQWESIPVSERPIVEVENPPFAADKWTHVVVTFSAFNSGADDGLARLYLDGKLIGSVNNRRQNYHWDVTKARIKLGLSYIGLFDELAIFNRALNDAEVLALYQLENGVRSLVKERSN